MTDNHLKKLLEECEDAYLFEDYERLIGLCDEMLKIDPACPNAMGYKGIACCFLERYDEALEVLEKGAEIYPDNYYLKNNLSMVYYDLGEYEKSLRCCEEGLKIKDFDWLYENKIKALLKLDRIDDANETWENSRSGIEFEDYLIEAQKYSEALEYFLGEDLDDYGKFIDKTKRSIRESGCEIIPELSAYFTEWIYKIKSRSDTRVCRDCGGKLVPILWGYF